MITPEEWDNLKVGDEIYYVYPLSTSICTSKITKIDISTKNKKKVKLSQNNYLIDYKCFIGDFYFINKKEALNHLITQLTINICELKIGLREARKQQEQENGE